MTRWIIPAVLGLLAVAGAACNSVGPGLTCGGSGATATVTGTAANVFSPNAITITAGQSVCWQSSATVSHTVTADDGSFDSPLEPNQTFTRTFATAGTFSYHCFFHAGMVGTVTVN